MVALVTNTVILTSSTLTLDREVYLAHVTEAVDWTIPFAIMLNCSILLLQYFLFPQGKRNATTKSSATPAAWTYIISFLVWLNYSMYHVLAGQYSLFSILLMVFSLIYLLAWILCFYRKSRTTALLSGGVANQGSVFTYFPMIFLFLRERSTPNAAPSDYRSDRCVFSMMQSYPTI
jgi:hypothetical protein